MLNFISAKEASEKWNISQRRVAILCANNRIPGAMMVGKMWIIPSTAEKPNDLRKHTETKSQSYSVVIEETCSQAFTVTAKNPKDAYETATKKYKNGEFVLDNPCLLTKKIAVFTDDNEQITEWKEF